MTVGGKNISDFCEMSVRQELQFLDGMELTHQEHLIGDGILKEVRERLGFLQSVGLDYLTLPRGASGLSGGESQRIRLATQIGSALTGVLYVLDEPSTGLHVADVHKLIGVLDRLVEGGNTVVIIEHNLDIIKRADYIIDLGPEGGSEGGTIVATGTPEEVAENPASYTGRYLKPILERDRE